MTTIIFQIWVPLTESPAFYCWVTDAWQSFNIVLKSCHPQVKVQAEKLTMPRREITLNGSIIRKSKQHKKKSLKTRQPCRMLSHANTQAAKFCTNPLSTHAEKPFVWLPGKPLCLCISPTSREVRACVWLESSYKEISHASSIRLLSHKTV